MGGNAQDVHGPGLDLHDEEDIHTPEQHGIDMQEVAGQDAGRLAGEELPTGRRRPPRRGSEASGGQDPADRPSPTRCPRPISSPWMRLYPRRGFAAPAAPPAPAPRPGRAVAPTPPDRSISFAPGAGARPARFRVSRSGATADARAAARPARRERGGQPSPASVGPPDATTPRPHAGGPRSPRSWRRHRPPPAPPTRTSASGAATLAPRPAPSARTPRA